MAILAIPHSQLPESDTGTDFHLHATIRLESQQYCIGSEKSIGSARFQLRVQIQNDGHRPVLLCRKYVVIWTPSLRYIRSDGSSGDLAYGPMPDNLVDAHYPKNLAREYAIIQPHDSYVFEGATAVLLYIPSPSPKHPKPRLVAEPGNFLLQVEITTWEGPDDAAKVLRDRWRAHGDLFTGYLMSDLIPLKIDPPLELPRCSF